MKFQVQGCKSQAMYVPNQEEALVPNINKCTTVNRSNGEIGLGPGVPKVIDMKC